MRFFLEPIVLTINYATQVLGYKQIVMMGLSGGGWSTTIAAAIDPRIQLSMPTAGSIPCDFLCLTLLLIRSQTKIWFLQRK